MLSHTRTRVLAALLAASALAPLLLAGGAGAQGGRTGRIANENASGGSPRKRIIVGQTSSSAQGSRQRITSDSALRDYSAYRSGDRFYVVLPKADASVVRRTLGRGYTDMQVQQRGSDVVLSYKLQPGAKPRVEQRFNHLDVVFDMPEGTQQAPPQAAASTPQPTPAEGASRSGNANTQPPNQAATRPTPAPAATPAPDEKQNAAEAALQSGAAQTPSPTSAGDQAQAPVASPEATQLAQTLQPVAPNADTAVRTQEPAPFLGAVLLRNWPFALSAALLVVALGFFFLMRRRAASAPARERRPKPQKVKVEERPRPLPQDEGAQSLADGTVLQGRYRVVRHLGRGGMGSVYEAADGRLGRTVALKMTLARSAHLRRAFEREARILANLSHPALPRVIDHFSEGDEQFLVMDYVPGPDLKALLEQQGRPFDEGEVLGWADELLDALEYLHSHEPAVVHRDIKPSNLKLTAKRRIVLLDFGLAKGGVGQTASATLSRSLLGYSPHFAPPEQMQGERTDPRSDLYALAATLYSLLTGQTPPDALRRVTAQLNDEPDPLRPLAELNPGVSAQTASVIMHALALKPSQRWPGAADMRAALKGSAHATTVSETVPDQASTLRGSKGAS